MRRLILLLAAALALAPLPALAQSSATAQTCTGSAIYDASTNGSTRLVVAREVGGIYVCGYVFSTANSSPQVAVKLIYGTGTACATGSVNLSPAYVMSPSVSDPSPYFRGMYIPPGNDLCINTNAGVAVQATVYFSFAQQR